MSNSVKYTIGFILFLLVAYSVYYFFFRDGKEEQTPEQIKETKAKIEEYVKRREQNALKSLPKQKTDFEVRKKSLSLPFWSITDKQIYVLDYIYATLRGKRMTKEQANFYLKEYKIPYEMDESGNKKYKKLD